ncbi:MAG: DNA-binding transcriptional LysR family regulator [Parasphingorhabdus sp.]
MDITILINRTMINELRAIYIFVKVAEMNSFRAAAQSLDLSPSVVSYHISRLEKKCNVALFYRSTRRLTLTNKGEKLLEEIQPLIHSVERELDDLSADVEQPVGGLKITAPAGFSKGFITRQIAQFAIQFPKIKLSISYSDLHEDIVASGIDLAIRGGILKDSGLKSRRIFELDRKLVASPDFISKLKLKSPTDLIGLNWVWHASTPTHRIFKHVSSKKAEKFKIVPTMIVDNGDAMSNLAMEGMGLITGPTYLLKAHMKSGKLVEVLPKWKLDPFQLYAVWPANSPGTGITSRFVDYLAQARID